MPAKDAEENVSFFQKLKHSYLDFIESLHEKGIPAPHLLVPLVIILILAGAVLYTTPGLLVEKKSITLTVKDNVGRAVPQATVQLLGKDSKVLDEKVADASGSVSFEAAPVDAAVRANAEGYTAVQSPVSTLLAQSSPSISLRSSGSATRNVEVRVLDENNQPVESAFVTLTFADGSLAPQGVSNAAGSALIPVEQTQLNDGTVSVQAIGFANLQQPFTRSSIESNLPLNVKMELAAPPAPEKGDFTVEVSSPSGPVRRARVVLVDQFTDAEQAGEFTSGDGSAVFQETAFGSVFQVRVTAVGFTPFSREFTFTQDRNAIQVSLLPRQAGQGVATLAVVNDQGAALESAAVNIFESGSNALLASGETDETGAFSIELGAGVTAYATAYIDGFLPGFESGLTPGSQKTISLLQVTAGSTTQVTVEVKEDGFPASGAEVSLYRSGGFFLGLPPMRAGAQGLANATIPLKFQGSTYRLIAKASKESLSGQSDFADVTQEPFSISVDLIALPANVTVSLVDLTTGNAVSSGSVEARVEGLTVSMCSLSTAGSCMLAVTPNKPFNLYTTAPGYLSYTSAQTGFSPGDLANVSLKLFPLSLAQGASVSFLGLFDATGAKVREVVNADIYTARFAVTMPQNTLQAGFYLRAGDEADALSSVATITRVDSNGAQLMQASTGFDLQSSSCFAGEAVPSNAPMKWVYLSFPRGFTGTREIAAKVQVSRTATSADSVSLFYRAFGFKDNLPLLAPSDAALLSSLREKIDAGQQLLPEDTCQAQFYNQVVPLSPVTLQCLDVENAEICYKLSLSDSATRGSPSTFQATLGRDVTAELEVLANVAVDSLALRTSSFTVSNARQTLAQNKVSLASEETNLPFVTLPNRKGKLTFALSPLLSTQNAQLTFTLRSGETTYEIPVTLSISGVNTFSVSASPQQIPAASPTRVSILVRDRNSAPVEDATVSFYDCSGSPFSGSEPNEIIGDASTNNGGNGRYRMELNPTGLGEIGVRVERDGFKTSESCLLTVQGRNFIEVEPQVLEFIGSSQDTAPQQVTVINKLTEPIRVSTSINCGSDAPPLRVFPSAFAVEPNSDSLASVKVIPNVSSNTQCIVTFNARAGTYKAVEEIPVSVNVNCPACTASVPATGSSSRPLPGIVTLHVDPFYLQDAVTLPLALPADPTCRLDGFRITYGGTRAPGLAPLQLGPPIQQGTLAGLPQANLWNCAVCQPGGQGQNTCQACQQVQPSQYACGACTPLNPSAPTSSSLPIHEVATCNSCYNAFAMQRAYSFQSPLAYRGVAPPFNPAVQRFGFDPSVGAPYIEDHGNSFDFYNNRFGVYPAGMPGSSRFFGSSDYNYGHGFSREAVRDALQVEECSRDGITIAADFSYLGQVYPGSGTLSVTMPDGSRKQIRVVVTSFGYGRQVPFGLQAPGVLQQQCAISSFNYDARIGGNWKTVQDLAVKLTCDLQFSNTKLTIKTANGEELNANSCTARVENDEVKVNCDFSNDNAAQQALSNDRVLFTDIEVGSNQNPDAKLAIHITLIYIGGTAQAPPGASDQPTGDQPTGDQPPITQPTTTPTVPATPPKLIQVYNAADSSFTNLLCDKQVQLGTDFKLKYEMPQGDDATKRQIEIRKGTAVEATIPAGQLTAQQGVKNDKRTTIGTYTYVLSTEVNGDVVTDSCQVEVITGPVYMQGIYHDNDHLNPRANTIAIEPMPANVFPDYSNNLSIRVNLDQTALRSVYSNKQLRLVKEFICSDDHNFILFSNETLTPSGGNSYTSTESSPARLTPNGEKKQNHNSLLFTMCQNRANNLRPTALDRDVPYFVRAKLYEKDGNSFNLISEKYEGANGAPVDTPATAFNILFYPEAPFSSVALNPPAPANAQALDGTSLDPCGRFQVTTGSPAISAVYAMRKNPGGGVSFLKSTDKLSPSGEYIFTACTGAVNPQHSQVIDFYLEFKGRGSQPAQNILLSNCPLGNSHYCSASIDLSAFPTMFIKENLLALGIDPDAEVKLKVYLTDNGQINSERYYCKRWPNGQTDKCDAAGKAVEMKLDFGTYPRTLSRYCIPDPSRGNNPNVLLCDIGRDTAMDIPLPNGMHFQATSLRYDASEKELKYKVYYQGNGVPQGIQGDTLDCDDNSIGDEAEIDLTGTRPGRPVSGSLGESCWGDDLSAAGATLLVPIRVVKVLDNSKEIPIGKSTKAINAIVRIRINTLFGANQGWLDSYFKHSVQNYVLSSNPGSVHIIYTPKFHASPHIPMSDSRLLGSGNSVDKDGIYKLTLGDGAKIGGDNGGIVRFIAKTSRSYWFEVRDGSKPELLNCDSSNVAMGTITAVGAGAGVLLACIGTGGLPCVLIGLGAGGLAGATAGGITDIALENMGIPPGGLSIFSGSRPEPLEVGLNELKTCEEGQREVLVKVLKENRKVVQGHSLQEACVLVTTRDKQSEVENKLGSLTSAICDA